MSNIARPPKHPSPLVKHVLHRVHPFGRHPSGPLHESDDEASAHAHALEQSKLHPLQRFDVFGVPNLIPTAKGGVGGADSFVSNADLRYEVIVAQYQAGKEIPIT